MNDDQKPARGWGLEQSPASGGTIAGIGTDAYDDDTTHTDQAGRNVCWLAAA